MTCSLHIHNIHTYASCVVGKYIFIRYKSRITSKFLTVLHIQGGAELTDTFQKVIDNIWKQGKIIETVYKYVQVCYLFPTDYKLIF